jgi:hypothetical protein
MILKRKNALYNATWSSKEPKPSRRVVGAEDLVVLVDELNICGTRQIRLRNIGTNDQAVGGCVFPMNSPRAPTGRQPALNLPPRILLPKVAWFIGCDVVGCSPSNYVRFSHCKAKDANRDERLWRVATSIA